MRTFHSGSQIAAAAVVLLCALASALRGDAQPQAGQAEADARAERLVRDWLRKADDLFNRGLTDDARRIYVRVMEAGPETELGTQACAGLLLTFAAPGGLAVDDCREWAAKNLDREWVERLEIAAGQWYLKRRRYDEGIQLLTAIAEANAGNRDTARALIARAQRERDEAAAELARNVSAPVAMRETVIRVPEAKGGPPASALSGIGQASAAEMAPATTGQGAAAALIARVTPTVMPVETAGGVVTVASVGVAPQFAGNDGPGIVNVGAAERNAVPVTQPASPVVGAHIAVRGAGIPVTSPATSMAESVSPRPVGAALNPVSADSAVVPVARVEAPQPRVGMARENAAWSGAFATAPAPLALTPSAAEKPYVSPGLMPTSSVEPVRGGTSGAGWMQGVTPGTATAANASPVVSDGSRGPAWSGAFATAPAPLALTPAAAERPSVSPGLMPTSSAEPVRGGTSVAGWMQGVTPGTATAANASPVVSDGSRGPAWSGAFATAPAPLALTPAATERPYVSPGLMPTSSAEPVRGGTVGAGWLQGVTPGTATVGNVPAITFDGFDFVPYTDAVVPMGVAAAESVRGRLPASGWTPGAGPAVASVGGTGPVALNTSASIPHPGAVQSAGALPSGEVIPRTGMSPGAIGVAASADVSPAVPRALVAGSGWSGSLAGSPSLLAPTRGAFSGYSDATAVTVASPAETASIRPVPTVRPGLDRPFDYLALAFIGGATPSFRETIANAHTDALQSDIVPNSSSVATLAWSAPAGISAAAVEASQIAARGPATSAYWGGPLSTAPSPQALVPDPRSGGRPSPGMMSTHVASVRMPATLTPDADTRSFPAASFAPVLPAARGESYAGGVAFASNLPGAPVGMANRAVVRTSAVVLSAPGGALPDGAVRVGDTTDSTGAHRVVSAASTQEVPWSLRPVIGSTPTATGESAAWNTDKLDLKISAELMKSGEKLLKDGRVDAARDTFRRVLTLDKAGAWASAAADRLMRTFGSADKPDVDACRAWAAQYVPAGVHRDWLDVALAEALYRQQALDRAAALVAPIADGASPARCAALLVRAMCAMQRGDRSAALASLAIIRADPSAGRTGPRALFLIGWLNLQAQDYRQAEAALYEFVKRYPEDPLVRRARELLSRIAAASSAEAR